MKKKDLLKQLNILKSQIQPDLEWQKTSREILVSQIRAQTTKDISIDKILWPNLLAKKFLAVAYKPLAAVILMFGIILGGYITTVGATRNSLPGDLLYSIKLTAERMQVNFASSDEKKVNLEIAFAERRLEEIKKVSAQGENGNKQENLKLSLQKYQESITNIKSGLVKLEQSDSATALKVANLVDEKTKDYVGILKDQETKNPKSVTTIETKEAITASQSIGEKALDVIVKEYQAGNKEVTFDMVYQKVEAKYNQLNDSMQATKDKIALIIVNKKLAEEQALAEAEAKAKAAAEAEAKAQAEAAAKAAETPAQSEAPAESTNQTLASETLAGNVNQAIEVPSANVNQAPEVKPAEILPKIEEIKDKPAEAQKLLDEARGFLIIKEVVLAYARIKAADEIMALVNKVIEANGQYLQAPVVIPAEGNVEGKIEE